MVGLAAWVLRGFRVCGLSILKMVPVLIAYVLILRQSTRMAVMVSASVSPSAASTQVVPNGGRGRGKTKNIKLVLVKIFNFVVG